MLNMLKVHGGNRVAQRAGNRIRSPNAGSPGSVVAEVCWDWKSLSSYSCSVLSRHQLPRERHSPSQRDITATGVVQQPPLGQELAPCRRALMIRRGEACMVTARSMENVYLSLLCLFRMFFFIKNLLITNDWSQNSPFSTLLDGAYPSHHTASFRGILVILVKWRQKADDKVLCQLPSYWNA